VVQTHDTAIDQLRHRRANLAERAELTAAGGQLARVESALGDLDGRVAGFAGTQQKFESGVTALGAKAAQVSRALSPGTVPRELQALQEELDGMHRRKRLVEDHIIEVMEEIEPLDAERARLDTERADLDSQSERLLATIAESETTIDTELEHEVAARDV